MEFMFIYILAILAAALALCLAYLFVSLGMKGTGCIMGLWAGVSDDMDSGNEKR